MALKDKRKHETVRGRLVKLGPSFGFVAPLDGSEDIFIPGHGLRGALPQDVVEVGIARLPRVPGSREGEVLSIVQPHGRLVGRVEQSLDGKGLLLAPDNAPDTPLRLKKGAENGAQPGEKVAAEVLRRGERHEDIRVGVVQRFGDDSTARQCAEAVLFAAGVEAAFPVAVLAEAEAMAAAEITEEELAARADLRETVIFTIDSEGTKDIDDAISLARTAEGYALGVHIADVSHYVRPETALDEEAFARGTSIYYADSVIPMLPAALSNGACSLNAGEDRLALSCLMELDGEGQVRGYSFKKSVIRSRVKAVYAEVNALYCGDESAKLREKYAEAWPALEVMRELYEKLVALRQRRGAIDFEGDEAAVLVDGEGRCVGIERRERGLAERLIEEFMLLANAAAANLARLQGLPFVYRVHEAPGGEKLARLKNVLGALGIPARFKAEVPTQQELSALLEKTRGTGLEIPVHTAVLRSMAKAVYGPQPKGHYGLALEDYAHFTSPIRRYPDLAVHRILTGLLAGAPAQALHKRFDKFAKSAARRSTERELVAVQAERGCDDCYKAEYMRQFIGQCFDGVIISAVAFGLYVALPNTVEGLVHASQLSSGRMGLADGVALTDARTGKSYRVGDAIRVRLAGVDISRGNIDFVPEEMAWQGV